MQRLVSGAEVSDMAYLVQGLISRIPVADVINLVQSYLI